MGSIEQHCVQFLSVARETRRTRGEEKVLVRGGQTGGEEEESGGRWMEGGQGRWTRRGEGGWKHGSVLEEGRGGGDTEGGAGKQNKRGKPLAIFH